MCVNVSNNLISFYWKVWKRVHDPERCAKAWAAAKPVILHGSSKHLITTKHKSPLALVARMGHPGHDSIRTQRRQWIAATARAAAHYLMCAATSQVMVDCRPPRPRPRDPPIAGCFRQNPDNKRWCWLARQDP